MYNAPWLNTPWERVLEQGPGVVMRDDNLIKLWVVERESVMTLKVKSPK
jgi:hypothetical protein